MKPLILLIAALAFLGSDLPGETLTDKSGRAIEVEIVRANETHVWAKLANRSISKISRDLLDKKSQEAIEEWRKTALPLIKVDKTLARGHKKNEDKKWKKVQTFKLRVALENRDPHQGIEEAEVKIFLIGRADWDKSIFKVLEVSSQTTPIPADQTTEVAFGEIQNFYSDKLGFHALHYVVEVTRKSDGRLIYEGSDNSVLDKRTEEIRKFKENDVFKSDFETKLKGSEKRFASRVVRN